MVITKAFGRGYSITPHGLLLLLSIECNPQRQVGECRLTCLGFPTFYNLGKFDYDLGCAEVRRIPPSGMVCKVQVGAVRVSRDAVDPDKITMAPSVRKHVHNHAHHIDPFSLVICLLASANVLALRQLGPLSEMPIN